MPLPFFKYSAISEAPVYEMITNNTGKKIINKILLGTYVKVINENGDYYEVVTAGPNGWMKKTDLADNMGIKVFYWSQSLVKAMDFSPRL